MPTAGDAGFEYPDTHGGYTYNPATDSSNPWTFAGDSGVAGNGSGFTSGNPDAPERSQVAFLQQSSGDISQSVTFAAGTFTLSFAAAQRSGDVQDFQVLLDGTPIDTVTAAGASYADYTTPSFTVTAGSHTIEFQGLDTAGGDNTAFIANVRFKAAVVSGSYRASYDAIRRGVFQQNRLLGRQTNRITDNPFPRRSLPKETGENISISG
jgi:hypothetical protein